MRCSYDSLTSKMNNISISIQSFDSLKISSFQKSAPLILDVWHYVGA